MKLRHAKLYDLPAIKMLYDDYIATSLGIYREEPRSLDELEEWFDSRTKANYPIFLAEKNSQILGFASFSNFHSYSGYRYTIENSLYLSPCSRGQGLGLLLMNTLIEYAKAQGKKIMIAVIDSQNTASICLHQKLGFVETGRLPAVGFKWGYWLDALYFYRNL